ncbi:hypothetical protein ABZ858_14755 [Streptomyces sp. NPDC047017]|uniref:hypothetical protein n=1 Tax=Streptomyces sp. NPDC047017 TaxID=3155024 RepID=UPI003402F753
MPVNRILAASAVCVTVTAAIGVAGCAKGSSDDRPFAGQSADQVASRAVSATRNASSLHMTGKVYANSRPLTVDFHVDNKKTCKGRMTSEQATADVIHADQATYIKGNEAFWQNTAKNSGGTQKETQTLSRRWVKVPMGDAGTTGLCDKQGFLAEMDSDKSERQGMTKGETSTVDGHQAIALKKNKGGGETITMYVATEGKPYILKVDQSGGKAPSTMAFSDYEKPVSATPPPPGQVIDRTKPGGAGA